MCVSNCHCLQWHTVPFNDHTVLGWETGQGGGMGGVRVVVSGTDREPKRGSGRVAAGSTSVDLEREVSQPVPISWRHRGA